MEHLSVHMLSVSNEQYNVMDGQMQGWESMRKHIEICGGRV